MLSLCAATTDSRGLPRFGMDAISRARGKSAAADIRKIDHDGRSVVLIRECAPPVRESEAAAVNIQTPPMEASAEFLFARPS